MRYDYHRPIPKHTDQKFSAVTFLAKHARKQQRPRMEVNVLAKENGSGLELLRDLINRAQHGQN
jgi:hypothetical protein